MVTVGAREGPAVARSGPHVSSNLGVTTHRHFVGRYAVASVALAGFAYVARAMRGASRLGPSMGGLRVASPELLDRPILTL